MKVFNCPDCVDGRVVYRCDNDVHYEGKPCSCATKGKSGCEECHGYGVIYADCPDCGHGGPYSGDIEAVCPMCNGTGYTDEDAWY